MATKSHEQLEKDLQDQMHLMRHSANIFDQGNLLESMNLALRLRILLHDTKHSSSLLGILNKKDKIINTRREKSTDSNIIYSPTSSLIFSLIGNNLHPYSPNFDTITSQKLEDFDTWWNDEVIKDFDNELFSRKFIILTIADKMGGAHIDVEIPDKYYKLDIENSMQRFTGPAPVSQDGKFEFPKTLNIADLKPVSSPTPYIVRQIAHEILRQFVNDYNPLTQFYNGMQFADIGLVTTESQ